MCGRTLSRCSKSRRSVPALHTTHLYLLDQLGARRIEKLIRSSNQRNSPKEQPLCCRQCGTLITHRSQSIEQSGAHCHTFTNPQQIRFTIGCFSGADGCRCEGQASMEHTWFAGYAWRIALCGSCGQHLGWRFEASSSGFFGLILDQLTECGNRSH